MRRKHTNAREKFSQSKYNCFGSWWFFMFAVCLTVLNSLCLFSFVLGYSAVFFQNNKPRCICYMHGCAWKWRESWKTEIMYKFRPIYRYHRQMWLVGLKLQKDVVVSGCVSGSSRSSKVILPAVDDSVFCCACKCCPNCAFWTPQNDISLNEDGIESYLLLSFFSRDTFNRICTVCAYE